MKTTIVVGGGLVLGPIPAMVVGGVTAGGAKIAENCCDSESDKKVFRFIGDCGGGIATGGAVGAGRRTHATARNWRAYRIQNEPGSGCRLDPG